MPNLLILTEVQEAIRARYKAMLLERFPQLTINVVGHIPRSAPISPIPTSCCASRRPWPTMWCASAKKLKWIQALGTGVDNIVDLPSLGQEVIVTNIRGIHGAPVSEATIAYMLSLARDLPRSVHAQDRAAWERWPSQPPGRQDRRHPRRRADRGISGADLQAFGMTVIGITGSAARDQGLRPHGGARRSGQESRPSSIILVALVPMSAGDPQHHRREGVRRHEADCLPDQCRARRRGRRGRRLIVALDQRDNRRRRARRVRAGTAAARQARCGRRRT